MLVSWIIGLVFSSTVMAADCNSADISLTSQDQVNNFETTYGPCDHVTGDLTIEGADISHLDGLMALIGVAGTLNIKNNPALENINGLSRLESVGGNLFVENNAELNNLDGLDSLATIGQGFYIFRNESLQQIDGLKALISVGYHFYISLNPSLESIDGLAALERVENWLRFWANEELSSINGFNGLREIGIGLDIDDNPALVTINGFTNLESPLSGVLIQRNDSLKSIGGLSRMEWTESLLLSRNSALSDLQGLVSLKKVGHLTVKENPVLQDLNGLSALREAHHLTVTDNENLSDCQGVLKLVDPVDDYEPGPGPGSAGVPDVADRISMQNNARGCNSITEVVGEAPLAVMNAGLNDAWFNIDTNGQGFLVAVLPGINQIFVAWFTYDTERPPEDVQPILGEPGHRWLTAQGEYTENEAELILYVTSGGEFDAVDPIPETESYGELFLEFTSCSAGEITYDIPSVSIQGFVPIQRIAPDNIPLCYLLGRETPE